MAFAADEKHLVAGLRDPSGMAGDESIRPVELQLLSEDEVLGPATVRDFWRWALGDLRMNNARGYLVEFLVAQALGDPSPMRVEWGSFDVQAADGTRVEVKTTGRLQSWTLKKLSTPTWNFKSVRAKRVWSEDRGDYEAVDPDVRVHVWIFALQTALDPALYDPLNFLEQWEFRVVPHRQLLATGQTSGRLALFERLGISPVTYAALPAAVASARQANDALGTRHSTASAGERASRWTSPGCPLGTRIRRLVGEPPAFASPGEARLVLDGRKLRRAASYLQSHEPVARSLTSVDGSWRPSQRTIPQ